MMLKATKPCKTHWSGGFLPLTLAGAKNPIPITYVSSIPSAQVKSAVLLASLNAPGETVFKEPSRSRDHTERMLKSFGAEISSEIQDSECVISCNGYAELNAQEVFVPGDPSSAAFPICAALMVEGSKVKILNVCQNDTRNGLVITLKEMGAKKILDRTQFMSDPVKALDKGIYSSAVDAVGGEILAKIISMISNHGVVSCCGNVAGPKFTTSVFPFILRGIQLCGIDSAESSIELKQELWNLLSNQWSLDLSNQTKIVGITEVEEEIDKILQGNQIGRVVIKHGE